MAMSLIQTFGFQPEDTYTLSSSSVTVSGGVVGLKYAQNPSALAPGQPPQKYDLGEGHYVRTRLFAPGIFSSWGFIQLMGEEDDDENGTQVTFLEARIWDGTEALYWDGAAWSSAGATDFNTLADFNENLPSFTGSSIAFEIRLRTTDAQYTPVLGEVCLKWEGKNVSFLREWVVNTLVGSLKDSIRPRTDYPVKHTGGSTVALVEHPLDASWDLTDIIEVYDQDNDPDHETNLFSSYDSTESRVTLTGTVSAGTVLWLVARYAPQVAVTTSTDYFEGAKSPAILVTMIEPSWGGKTLGARGPHVIDVTRDVPAGTVFPTSIPLIDVDIALATVAPTSQDLIVLNEALGSWLDAHPTLRSSAFDQEVKMYPGSILNWNTTQFESKDPRLASGTLRLVNIPMIGDPEAGAADGGATASTGAVDAGDAGSPGVGYGVASLVLTTSFVGTGADSSLTITEE